MRVIAGGIPVDEVDTLQFPLREREKRGGVESDAVSLVIHGKGSFVKICCWYSVCRTRHGML